MNRIVDALLGLIYPRKAQCMGCGSQAGLDRDWLCEDCRALMPKLWLGADALPESSGFVAAAFAAAPFAVSFDFRIFRLAFPGGFC